MTLGGLIGSELVKTMIFSKKSGLKTVILAVMVLDQMTLEWAGTSGENL